MSKTTRALKMSLAFYLLTTPISHASEQADETPRDDLQALSELSLEELLKIRISPFELSTQQDRGYLASNSVSGSRFNAPIKDLPFALQAFTEDFINDQKPRNIFDVAKYSPSVTYRSNDFNEGNANLAIRGFAVSSTAGSPQILRDGFHGPSIFDFTNISRVEVVKGPSSFLYGQVAPGGIVNIITKRPQGEFAADGSASYGSYNAYRLQADVTGPATEKLFYRFASSYDRDIQYWDLYNAHSWDLAPSLLWQPTNRISFSVTYELFRKSEDAQVMQKPGRNIQKGVVPTDSDPNLSGVDVPGLADTWNSMSDADFRNSDTNNLTTTFDFKLNDRWNLRASYAHLEYEVDAVFSGNFGMANNTTLLQGRRFKRTIYSNRDDTAEVEALGKYQFEKMSLRLLLGAQLVSRSFDDREGQAPNDPALGNDPVASPFPLWDLSNPSTWDRGASLPLSALTANPVDQTTTNNDKAIYAGSTLGLFDNRLLLLAGLRFTDTESQINNNLTSTSSPTFEASKFTPQYGVLYKLTPGLSLFGSYAESFVPNSQILRVDNNPIRPAVPTEGKGVDTGIKADLLDGRVSGTLTFFLIQNENIINDITRLDPTSGVQIFTNLQSGKQRSRGIELDATLTLTEKWQTYLSYSYMDAKIIEVTGNDDAILAQDPATLSPADQEIYKTVWRYHGAPLQMSAPHLANLWTRYDFAPDGPRSFYVAGGMNLVFDQTLLPDTPKDYHQSYGLLNALLGYRFKLGSRPTSIELSGKNLTDVHYRPSQSSRGRPREIALWISMRF